MTVPSYCTPAQIKAEMPDLSSQMSTTYDALLTDMAAYASRLIDRYCGRQPGAFAADTDSVRYYDGGRTLEQWIDEIAAAPTTVAVAETGHADDASGSGGLYTTWAASDYRLWPYNAAAEMKPYRRMDIDLLYGTKATWYSFHKCVKVTGKWGYSTTANQPPEIGRATIATVVRWWMRAQQGFRDTGGVIELGKLVYTKSIDPEVEMLLGQAGLRRLTI